MGIDNIAASREMVNGIIKRGCKRIALITGDQKNARVRTFSYEREIGYMKALLEGGIKYDPGIVMTGAITEDAGYELTKNCWIKIAGLMRFSAYRMRSPWGVSRHFMREILLFQRILPYVALTIQEQASGVYQGLRQSSRI